MRTFLTTLVFTLTLLAGVIGGSSVVYAAGCPAGQFADTATVCWPTQAAADAASASYASSNELTAGQQAASLQAAAGTPISYSADSQDSVMNGIMSKIATLFAWLVGVAALTLDYAVYYTVINMGSYVSNLTAIGVTWRILRDIGNIMLIFGFLAIGITTILNVSWYGDGKKMLPMLLLAAVFLNFSLFFSEAIIDVGNLFATQFYTQINGGVPATAASLATLSIKNEGISNKLMSQLGLATLYGNAVDPTQGKIILKDANPWYVGFMGIILFIVTAFVMFSLAFILIARFVMLIFLIILAPVGFAGLAIPQLKGKMGQWWETLLHQTFIAPILLLVLYVALAVITDAKFLIPGSATGFVENSNLAAFANYLISFMIAIGLMFAVTISAKKLGAVGASGATKLAGKLSFGATAWGLRSTVGSGSRMLAQRMRASSLNNTKRGRLLIRGAEYGAKSSFDVRGATIGGGLKSVSVDAGEAAKGGYQGARDKAMKKHEEYIKATDAVLDERNLRRGTLEEDEEKAKAADLKLSGATQAHTEAKDEHAAAAKKYTAVTEKHTQHLAEIKKIEEEKVTNAAEAHARRVRLEVAQVKAEASEVDLVATKKEMEFAKDNLDKGTGNLNKVAKEVKDKSGNMKNAEAYQAERVGEEKKQQKLEYAESISGLSSILSGPGAAMAARKIVKDAMKPKDTAAEEYAAFRKKVEKEVKDAAAATEKETPAPAAEPAKLPDNH